MVYFLSSFLKSCSPVGSPVSSPPIQRSTRAPGWQQHGHLEIRMYFPAATICTCGQRDDGGGASNFKDVNVQGRTCTSSAFSFLLSDVNADVMVRDEAAILGHEATSAMETREQSNMTEWAKERPYSFVVA